MFADVEKGTLKQASDLTPATTPEETSPSNEIAHAGNKIFGHGKSDVRERDLAAKLTLEEQVGYHFFELLVTFRNVFATGFYINGLFTLSVERFSLAPYCLRRML